MAGALIEPLGVSILQVALEITLGVLFSIGAWYVKRCEVRLTYQEGRTGMILERLTGLEQKHEASADRLDRIEGKLDRLIEGRAFARGAPH